MTTRYQIVELVKRRLDAKPRPCPKCGCKQVQLREWLNPPLHWKCRECKHTFH